MELRTGYDQLMAFIEDIDTKLDSLTDGKSASRTRLINEYVGNTEEQWKPIVDKYIEQLNEAPAEVRYGIFYGVTRGLNKAFGKVVSDEIDTLVETLPKPEPLIQVSEVPDLSAARSKAFQQVKSIIELATQFGENDGMEMPKKRTGSKGKRGPRALSFWTWSVDGTEYATLKDVQKAYPQYEKVSELTKALKEVVITVDGEEVKFNTTKPQVDEIELELADGKILYGVKGETAAPEEEDDDDEEEEEVEEEVTE